MRVALSAVFSVFGERGVDGVDLAMQMQKHGIDVVPMPVAIVSGLPRAFTRLLERDPRGKVDAIVAYGASHEINGMPGGHAQNVAWLTPLPADWTPPTRWGEQFDLIIVQTPADLQSVRARWPSAKVRLIPLGIDEEQWPLRRRDPQRKPMVFLVDGAAQGRDPLGKILSAWMEAKKVRPDFDAGLVVAGLPEGAKVEGSFTDARIDLAEYDDRGRLGLYHATDALIEWRPTRIALEFMATGGPVIGRKTGLAENWLHDDVGWCTNGIGHLGPALVDAWENRVQVARHGEAAATWVRQTADWQGRIREFEMALT